LTDSTPFLIAGIDPGSRKTGYAFLEIAGNSITPHAYGVINAAKYKDHCDRYTCIHRELGTLLDRFRPGEAAVEDIFHHKNARSAFLLGQARGAILLTLALTGVKVFSYPPAVIKKAVTTYGRADKKQVCDMVKAILGLSKTPRTDAADALAIALTHAQTIRYRRML